MKTLTKTDKTNIVIGEWFDKVNGNTYYDAALYQLMAQTTLYHTDTVTMLLIGGT